MNSIEPLSKRNAGQVVGAFFEDKFFPGKNSSCFKRETLELLDALENACKIIKRCSPLETVWKVTCLEDGNSVESVSHPDFAWPENPVRLHGAEHVSTEELLHEPQMYSFHDKQVHWNKEKNILEFSISRKIKNLDEIQTIRFEVDLSTGEALSMKTLTFEVSSINGNPKEKAVPVFTLKDSQEVQASNVRFNQKFRGFVKDALGKAKLAQEEYTHHAIFVEFIEALSKESNQFQIRCENLTEFKELIDEVLARNPRLLESNDVKNFLKFSLVEHYFSDNVLRNGIVSGYVHNYSRITVLPESAYSYHHGEPKWLKIHDLNFGLKLAQVFGDRLEEFQYTSESFVKPDTKLSGEKACEHIRSIEFASLLPLSATDSGVRVKILSSDSPQVELVIAISSRINSEDSNAALQSFIRNIRETFKAIGYQADECVMIRRPNGHVTSLAEFEKFVRHQQLSDSHDQWSKQIADSFEVRSLSLEEVSKPENETLARYLVDHLESEKLNGALDKLSLQCIKDRNSLDALITNGYEALFFRTSVGATSLHVLLRQEGSTLHLVSGYTTMVEDQIASQIVQFARDRNCSTLTVPTAEGSHLRQLYNAFFQDKNDLEIIPIHAGVFEVSPRQFP